VQDGPEGYLIVAGHGIVEAARKLQYTELRADILPADWTSEAVDGYLIADNMHSKDAQDNDEMLVQLLQEQQDSGYDLASLGTDDETLRQMLESLGDEYLGESEGEEDDFDEEPDEEQTRVKLGDVWTLGRHKIMCGDSTDMTLVRSLLQDSEVQAIVSDPPYGMKLDAQYSFSKGSDEMSIKASRGYDNVIGDDKDFDASYLFKSFSRAKEIFLCGADYYVDSLPNYGKLGSWMVWDKKNEALRNVLGLADFELIWSLKKHKRRVYAILWNGALGTESEDTKKRVHPTQKPVRLLKSIIEEYVKPDMLVLDPFLGSGSTLIACEELEHTCYGFEIDPKYCNVILTRWEQLTNQQATLIERAEEAAHA
jgi:DNA modification methylase